MRGFALLALACLALGLLAACDDSAKDPGRATANAMRTTAGNAADQDPAHSLEQRLEEGRDAVGETVERLSQQADTYLSGVGETPLRGWIMAVLSLAFGLVMLFFGWALINSFLLPFAPVWGLLLGGFTAFAMLQTFGAQSNWQLWHRLVIVGAGAVFGVVLFLFTALRAKPIAAMLVVISPFIIVATFLVGVNAQLATAVFLAGFLAGFVAMLHLRPIAIFATALFGAISLLATYGAVAYLVAPPQTPGEEPEPAMMLDSVAWLLAHPWMLLLILAMVMFLGCNFQAATGPQGSLED